MRAVLLLGHGGLDRLAVVHDHPRPAPGEGEVLVQVGACAVNATDVNTRVGWYAQGDDNGAWDEPLRFPRIQGADVCGTVVSLGSGVDAATAAALLDRRVMVDPWLRNPVDPWSLEGTGYVGSEIDGGYAEFVVVPAANAHPVQSTLTDAELASFATSSGTALNMLERVQVGTGDTVLVTGASGGVGAALVQFARLRGATVVAVSTAAKADGVRALGAHVVLDRSLPLAAQLGEATGLASVDVVADVVGGAEWAGLIDLLRRGGRYVVSGAVAGPHVPLDLRTLYLRDLLLAGTAVQPPGLFARLVDHVERGDIVPAVSAVYRFDEVREAQAAFLERQHVGKIVLSGWA
jgi:NADPH:quinone reductase-like Zn-dependent oxidoreductase